jgi:metallo-beta-lactamase class B
MKAGARIWLTAAAGLCTAGLIGLYGVRAATALITAAKEWSLPNKPFKIAEGLYYVGSADLAAYLIKGGAQGDILLDGGVPENVHLVVGNIRALGFDPHRVRVLLNSHAHFDHAGALAGLKAATGAKLYVSPRDADVIEAGGHDDFAFGDAGLFPKAKVDHRLTDGETVRVGTAALTAHFTPGHTKGCTTWSGTFKVDGKPRHALFICSVSVLPMFKLVGDPKYPTQAQDFAATFARLKAMPCELFLASHANFYGMLAKRKAMDASPGTNPFVDPAGCKAYLERGEAEFKRRMSLVEAGKS